MEKEPYLEMADVARAVGLTTDAVTSAVKRGELKPCATTVRGSRLFTRQEVDRYREQREVRAAQRRRRAA